MSKTTAAQAPTPGRTDQLGTTYHHPAFAAVRASRVQCNGQQLFGSDFAHQHYIQVEISEATLTRGLSRDWIHGGVQRLVSLALSEAQWAHFVSSLNAGSGTPATLEYAEGRGHVPGLLPPTATRQDQFADEARETLTDAMRALRQLEASIKAAKLPAKTAKLLTDQAETARREIDANLAFVARSFGEFMETTTEKAKAEVDAYAAHHALTPPPGQRTVLEELQAAAEGLVGLDIGSKSS